MNYNEEKPSRGVSAAGFLLISVAVCIAAIAAPGFPSVPLYWMILGVLLVPIIVSVLLLKKAKPVLFKRRWGTDPIERGYELKLFSAVAVLSAATCFISSMDYFRLRIGYLGGWLAPVGVILSALGIVLYQQTLRAYGPHNGSRYDEEPDAKAEQGAYAQVRHPLASFFLLALLGVPLMFSSWLGLIGWALTAVTTVVYVVKEDRWRFMNYEWYYEYTRQVRHKIIPMIW